MSAVKPVQQKIYNEFIKNINGKIWTDKLPSMSVLCDEYNVNAKTLRKVIEQLVEDGLVDVRHGLGTFIRSQNKTSSPIERILVIVPYVRGYFISSLVKEFINYQENRNVEIMIAGYDDSYLENSLPEMLDQFDRVAILLLKQITPTVKRCLNEFSARGRLLALNSKIVGVNSMVVTGDNLKAGEDAVKNLHRIGYDRIAFLRYGNNNNVNPRQKGYEKGVAKLKLDYSKVISYQMNKKWLDNCFRKMIDKNELPQVMIFDWHPASVLAHVVLCKINPELADRVKILVFDPGEVEQEIGFYAMVQPLDKIVETTINLLTAKSWKCKAVNIPVEFIDYSKI